MIYPKDTDEKRKERKSFQLFYSLVNTDFWVYSGSDQNDHGVDYTFEFVEDEEYRGYRILAQIKSRSNPEIKNGNVVFDFPVKTANYAIGCAQPFFFFFVNLSTKEVNYLPLQDYFIDNKNKMNALKKNKETVRVFIPLDNRVENEELRIIAKSQYTFSEESGLRKVR